MSDPAFRAGVKSILTDQWLLCDWFDMSDYVALDDPPATGDVPVLLVEFIGGPETIATIGNPGNHGWRENGVFMFHLLFPTGEDSTRAGQFATELRRLFRGRRVGTGEEFIINRLDNATDFGGGAIAIDGRWHGWVLGGAYYGTVCG